MKLSKKLAYSKINLGLDVLFKRNDGFHEINTVFAKISLHDELIFEESKYYDLKVNSNFKIDDGENLVTKACQLFTNETGLSSNFKITLHKQIPIGAGLGGGSSDAATTLLFLNEFYDGFLSNDKLKNLSLKIGSDVPFFLGKNFAYASGRGEELNYFYANLPFKVLIINPNIHISTPWAYNQLMRTNETKIPNNYSNLIQDFNNNSDELKSKLKNDFESVVFKEYSQIASIKESLYSYGALFSLMSGSGSTVFGLFENNEIAEMAQSQFPDFFTYVADFVND